MAQENQAILPLGEKGVAFQVKIVYNYNECRHIEEEIEMKKLNRLGIGFIVLSLFLSACNLPQETQPGVSPDILKTQVAGTLTAIAQPGQPVPQDTPAQSSQATPSLSHPTSTLTLAASPTGQISRTPTTTPIPKAGAIEGGIYSYPYGAMPALAVVAYDQQSSKYWYAITTPGSTYYSMTDTANKGYVSPGKYQVVAYDSSGRSGGCTAIVTVQSEQSVTCDITDWSGSYRGKPAAVPNP
jgi:hypothetical protein